MTKYDKRSLYLANRPAVGDIDYLQAILQTLEEIRDQWNEAPSTVAGLAPEARAPDYCGDPDCSWCS